MTASVPEIVFLSGSLGELSRTNRLAQWCADQCAPRARTTVFPGAELDLPFYRPGGPPPGPRPARYLAALERADGVVLVSPVYHGTLSGLLKNALDYVNELAGAPQPYLDGRALGCVSIGLGEQGASSTLQTLRTVGHALRSWPTPMGVALSQGRADLTDDGSPVDQQAHTQLTVMLGQVMTMARLNARRRAARAERTAPAAQTAQPTGVTPAAVRAGGVR